MQRERTRPEAVLVRHPVEAKTPEEVAALVVKYCREHAESGVGALLPQDDVWTASVFLDEEADGPALWWYLEVTDLDGAWADPESAVRESPLFEAGLAKYVGAEGRARVYAPGTADSLQFVHAWLPDRPSRYRTGAGGLAEPDGEWQPRLVLAAGGEAELPDVVMVRWRLRSGLPTRFIRWFARFADWTVEGGLVERLVRPSSEKAMDAEEMWTESVFLHEDEEDDKGAALLGFMECADMRGVAEGFYETDSNVARISECFLGWLFENPRQALEYEAFTTDFEPLVHAVDPDRGRNQTGRAPEPQAAKQS